MMDNVLSSMLDMNDVIDGIMCVNEKKLILKISTSNDFEYYIKKLTNMQKLKINNYLMCKSKELNKSKFEIIEEINDFFDIRVDNNKILKIVELLEEK